MESIRECVINIIKMITKKQSDDLLKMVDDNLMGLKMNMAPIELVYLFDKLESNFGVHFSSDDLDNKDFYSINTITRKICDYKGI